MAIKVTSSLLGQMIVLKEFSTERLGNLQTLPMMVYCYKALVTTNKES